jgi:hypothetical protein
MGWKETQQIALKSWINTQEWDTFGALNFSSLHHIGNADRDDVCGKMWRSYFGAVDHALYGKQRKNQSRFQRVVFLQYGGNNDYPHVHFLAKSPINTEEFCIILNAIWASMYTSSARPVSNEFTPTIKQTGAIGYGLHEFYRLEDKTLDLRLSNFSQYAPHVCVRDDAMARLKQQATLKNQILARLEFPKHVQAAQARKERRERNAVAAMLR